MLNFPRTTEELREFMSGGLALFVLRLVSRSTEEELIAFLEHDGPPPLLVGEGFVLIPNHMSEATEEITHVGRVALHSFADTLVDGGDKGFLFIDRPSDDDPTRN